MVQWVKDLALSLQQLRSPLGVWSLALEFLHTTGAAKKIIGLKSLNDASVGHEP